jgi:hypothetical protein
MCEGRKEQYVCPSRSLCRRHQEYMATPPGMRRSMQVVQLYRQPSDAYCSMFVKKHKVT